MNIFTKVFSIVFFFLYAFVAAGAVYAQEENTAVQTPAQEMGEEVVNTTDLTIENILPPGAIKVAAVDIYSPVVKSYDSERMTISFDIFNGDDTAKGGVVQSQVRYGIRLLGKKSVAENDTFYFDEVVDEYIFEEELSLNPGETISKEVTYVFPPLFSGEYYINVFSQNSSGMNFSSVFIEEPIHYTLPDGVQVIQMSNCTMVVGGEEQSYDVDFGVDVAKDEQLFIECDLEAAGDVSHFVPEVTIFHRSLTGEKEKSEALGAMDIWGSPSKGVRFSIPLPEKPQAYDAQLVLLSDDGKVLSNKVVGHFVVRGASATIQDIQLDKDYYLAGEQAQVFLSVTGGADIFLGSRAFGNEFPEDIEDGPYTQSMRIVDENGTVCGEGEKQIYAEDKDGYDVISINIQSDCFGPIAEAVVYDKNGNILNEAKFSVETKTYRKINDIFQKEDNGFDLKMIISALAALFVAMAIGYFIYKKIKNKNHSDLSDSTTIGILFFIFAVSSVLVSFPGSVHAATYYIPASTPVAQQILGNQYYSELILTNNKASYCTSDTSMTISVSGYVKSCGNGDWGIAVFPGNVVASTPRQYSWPTPYYASGLFLSDSQQGNIPAGGSFTINIPDKTVGNHSITLTGANYQRLYQEVPSTSVYCDKLTNWSAAWPALSFPCYELNYANSYPASFNHAYTVIATTNGTCGARNTTYTTETAWPANTFYCSSGTRSAAPSFPADGATVTWSCNGNACGSSASCSAYNTPPTNGTCGTRNTTYTTETAWPALTATSWCTSGTNSASPAFPADGATATWNCNGSNGGTTASCSAHKVSGLTVDISVQPSTSPQVVDLVRFFAAPSGGVPPYGPYTWSGAVTGSGINSGAPLGNYIEKRFGIVGLYTATVQVTDSVGQTASDSQTINVQDNRVPQ